MLHINQGINVIDHLSIDPNTQDTTFLLKEKVQTWPVFLKQGTEVITQQI